MFGRNKVLDKYPDVFKDELGTLQGTRAKIHVDPQATPKFFKPHSVPYILRERLEKELDRLLSEGIIEPIQFSDWAVLIVPVVKEDGRIRIWGLPSYNQPFIQAGRLPHSKS